MNFGICENEKFHYNWNLLVSERHCKECVRTRSLLAYRKEILVKDSWTTSGDHEIERSAGGVLVCYDEQTGSSQVCLIQVPTRGGNPSWRLPKGWIEPEETSEEAALRETREETGCHGEILSELSEIDYWYTRKNPRGGERIRVQKIVKFYVMRYLSGSIEDHDHEVEEVRWYSFKDALRAISYDAEKRVLQEAIHSWDAHLYRLRLM